MRIALSGWWRWRVWRSINAVAESFFATLKNELIYPHIWTTR
jgi:hypothetical protein